MQSLCYLHRVHTGLYDVTSVGKPIYYWLAKTGIEQDLYPQQEISIGSGHLHIPQLIEDQNLNAGVAGNYTTKSPCLSGFQQLSYKLSSSNETCRVSLFSCVKVNLALPETGPVQQV